MRPGRLDRILYVGPPDQRGREDILEIKTSKMSVDPDLDLSELATLVCSFTNEGWFLANGSYFRRMDVLELKLLQCARTPLC
jgi:SpoVK/Ycf46/Vps4 family AAA+-type ATPase